MYVNKSGKYSHIRIHNEINQQHINYVLLSVFIKYTNISRNWKYKSEIISTQEVVWYLDVIFLLFNIIYFYF